MYFILSETSQEIDSKNIYSDYQKLHLKLKQRLFAIVKNHVNSLYPTDLIVELLLALVVQIEQQQTKYFSLRHTTLTSIIPFFLTTD